MLVNNASLNETFEVAVVDVGTDITGYREAGGKFNKTVGQGSSTLKTTSDNKIVNVELPESARIHGRYTLEPGERRQLSVAHVGPNKAIVILIYDEPEQTYRAIKSLSCEWNILGYKVTTEAEGEDNTVSGHQCG
jgi:hypothetical protein